MGNIWIPDGLSEEEIDLITNIEYAKFRLKLNTVRLRSTKSQIGEIRGFLRQSHNILQNLRSLKVRITSLREYRKIQNEINKAELMRKAVEAAVEEQESTIANLKAQISLCEIQLLRLQKRGKLLELKNYGRKKK